MPMITVFLSERIYVFLDIYILFIFRDSTF